MKKMLIKWQHLSVWDCLGMFAENWGVEDASFRGLEHHVSHSMTLRLVDNMFEQNRI